MVPHNRRKYSSTSIDQTLPHLLTPGSHLLLFFSHRVLARNFANIRDGDEYFYKNSIKDPELFELIEGTAFADVIRRNSDSPDSLNDLPDNVFFVH